MIDRFLKHYDIDLERSFVVGDRVLDMELAYNVGAKAIMVMTGYGTEEVTDLDLNRKPDYLARDLLDAVKWIERHA